MIQRSARRRRRTVITSLGRLIGISFTTFILVVLVSWFNPQTFLIVAGAAVLWAITEIILYYNRVQQQRLQEHNQFLECERDELDSQCRRLEKKLDAKTRQYDLLINREQSSARELQEAQVELDQTKEQKERANREYHTLIWANEQLQRDLEQAKEDAEDTTRENLKLIAENEQLKQDLGKAQGNLNFWQHRANEQQKDYFIPEDELQEDNATSPEFWLHFTEDSMDELLQLYQNDKNKYRKVSKTLDLICLDPRYPGLNTHKHHTLTGLRGEEVFISYVENHTPSAWRIFWYYGPISQFITIKKITPHP